HLRSNATHAPCGMIPLPDSDALPGMGNTMPAREPRPLRSRASSRVGGAPVSPHPPALRAAPFTGGLEARDRGMSGRALVALLLVVFARCAHAALAWEALPPLPEAISGHAAGMLGDTLVAAGGSSFPVS